MPEQAEVLSHKCPNCGATLPFNGKEGMMSCEYCGSEFDPEALRAADAALKEPAAEPEWEDASGQEWEDESKGLFHCNSCGAVIVSDATAAASFCPYCGNATVFTSRLSGELRPDLVIPFCVDKEEAVEALRGFCRRKPLLPRAFISENRIEKLSGVYVPFWLFDCGVDADMEYDATTSTSTREGDYMVTRVSHFRVRRSGTAAFEKLPVDGSQKMPDNYMEAIEPYDYTKAVDFATAYLSGYLADRYDVDSKESMPRANERIKASVNNLFLSTVNGYGGVIQKKSSIRNTSGRIQYALMPVWLLNTQYRGKTYTFAMNGQTGKFVGNLPVSAGKLCGWLFGIAAAVAAAGTLVCWLASLM